MPQETFVFPIQTLKKEDALNNNLIVKLILAIIGHALKSYPIAIIDFPIQDTFCS